MINCRWEGALSLSTPVEFSKYNGVCIISCEFQVCDEYLKSRSGCCRVEQHKGIFARYEPRYLSIDAAGWALGVNTSTENMPTQPAVHFSLTMRIFQQSINFFKKKASRIPSVFLGLTSDSCFFLFHELISSKHWDIILVTEVYNYRWWMINAELWGKCILLAQQPKVTCPTKQQQESVGAKNRSVSDSITTCVQQHRTPTIKHPEALTTISAGF